MRIMYLNFILADIFNIVILKSLANYLPIITYIFEYRYFQYFFLIKTALKNNYCLKLLVLLIKDKELLKIYSFWFECFILKAKYKND